MGLAVGMAGTVLIALPGNERGSKQRCWRSFDRGGARVVRIRVEHREIAAANMALSR